jgi:rubrerythrin
MELNLIIENKLGVTKGTGVEQSVAQNYSGENMEVGWYLAAARQAQREGFPEVAEVFKTIAWEEAAHAARFAELNGVISTTKENLDKAINGEQNSNRMKRESAIKAKEEGIDEAHDFFDEAAKDEARHARALKGIKDKLFSGL